LQSILYVAQSRKAYAEICCYLSPEAPANLLAVTGSSGKTSTVHYLAQFISSLGTKVATIGTFGIRIYHQNKIEFLGDTGLNTPDSKIFNETLSKLKKMGIEYCAMEASSGGLDQYRIYGRKFKACGFTSFSQDHLDYHGTMENYLNAKLMLFDEYMEDDSYAVINSDMKEISQISDRIKKNRKNYVTVGSKGDCKVRIVDTSSKVGQVFEIEYDGKKYETSTKIIGAFQVWNMVIAILMLEKIGFKVEDLLSIVPTLKAAEGRLERVDDSDICSRVFVDYSHKPDALEKALIELKSIADKRLIVVFGCGGDRDKSKRPIMGAIAAKYADLVIVTDDNPRHEVPAQIRSEVLVGCPDATEIGDRREAIKYGIDNLKEGDLLLIAGKGHEDYQIIGDEFISFCDKNVALEIIMGKE
jgi:UDP-N-acetylmuramoyl-L-alanyl-D-glutamate--2,6-diaminopimelate ligase